MKFRGILIIALSLCALLASAQQTVRLGAPREGKRFDGIGVVNGGGATAVLLKDYPEPQRSQIMDLVYKPMFGGSVSALLVEVPGDGNSTQGAMPSHSHYRGDSNFRRGYTWWVLREAKDRNPDLPLDATAWSGPGWVGGWWTPEMVDFYVSWLQGLRSVHGLEMDAIGCHNEKGWDAGFAKMLRKAMNERGFANVRLHGFDNWGQHKMDHIREMQKDPELRDAIDVISAHTFSEIPLSEEDRKIVESLGKPLWNSEEHVYRKGFDGLIMIVKCFNENYIVSGATKIVNWYDIAGVYPMEPYSVDPATVLAHEPWSGHYEIRESLWGYAHYGQFSRVGWQYVDDGCKMLDGGGSMVTLRDPDTEDYSIIIETKDAEEPRKLTVKLDRSFGKKPLCVWYSDEKEQFVRKADIMPRGCRFTLTLQPGAVYSLSTTRGQQKGCFDAVPAADPFPIPYQEDFEGYVHPEEWGYLPHYTADLIGAFELTDRPDRDGRCLRQVVGDRTHSWAPEWHHYTILGDRDWEDYEVGADVWLNPGDEAGVMGRLCDVGSGYGVWAKGYYLKVNDQGQCTLVMSCGKVNKEELIGDAEQQALIKARKDFEQGGEFPLDSAKVASFGPCRWHSLKIRFEGNEITGFVDGKPVVKSTSDRYSRGMAGLIAPELERGVSTPYFDNLRITPLGCTRAVPTVPKPDIRPLYPR